MSTDIAPITSKASAIVVIDDASKADAENFIRELRSVAKAIEDHYKPHIEAAHKAHKSLTSERAAHLKPLEEAEKQVKQRISAFLTAKAMEERKALEAQQAAIRAKAEEERRKAEALAREAQQAEAFGATDLAETLKDDAARAQGNAHIAERSADSIQPGKPEGTRGVWKWRETGEEIPRQYLQPNKDMLDFLSRKARPEIKGIEWYQDFTVVIR